jgi:carboxyl-terminal processing protease
MDAMKTQGRRRRMRNLAGAFVLFALSSCGGDGPTSPQADASDCTARGQVRFVRDVLRDDYFWYRELSDPDPAGFRTPEEYLDAVRYKTFDSSFSYIASKAESDAFFSDSQFVGYGFRMEQLGPSDLRVFDVYAGSPAAEAGLQRGSRFIAMNGKPIAQVLAAGELGAALGPANVGVSVQMRFTDRAGNERDVLVVKRLVTIPTVAATRTYTVGDRVVGYVLFENFVRPSTEALDAAFARLRAEGANELVLDVRYNGGGLVSVAQHLGGLIGGSRTSGQPFVRFVHNDKNTTRDSTLPFPSPVQALGLSRLVVITTQSSASASELVVNALRPFMNVTVVGERTYGKPVGQYGYDFCEKTLFPVAFATRNARNDSDYFAGIPADCAAPDDVTRELGDPAEASLAESLQFLRTGRCTAAAAAAAHAHALGQPPRGETLRGRDGWQDLLGSY